MSVFQAAANAWRTGRRAAFVTVIGVNGSAPRSSGSRMLVYEDGSIVGTIGGGTLEHRAIGAAVQAISAGRPTRLSVHLTRDLGMCCGGAMEVFVEPLTVRTPVVIFGAGHVSRATAPLLASLDFDVTVVDERDELLTPERFPDCTLELTDARAYAEALPGDPEAFWLVVTHDHQLDQDLGEILLPRACAWMGMIGSRSKIAKFFIRYRAAGLDETLFRKLSAPVGLDLGAETPGEIAVAIAAEVVRVRRRCVREPKPMSSIPLPARGGDGMALPPALEAVTETSTTR